ncbi:hypothetical protein ACROYT_G020866 [Oculina patagonica]
MCPARVRIRSTLLMSPKLTPRLIRPTESKLDDAALDVFGMPGFSPSPTIHPSLSSASLTASDEVDKGATDSPALPRRSILPTSFGARDGFIKLHMAARESEYTHIKKLKIFVGTWNVNGQYPAEEVSPWLAADHDPPDVFSLGFQELDLSAETLLKNVTPREDEWLKMAEQGLHPKAQYTKVKTIRLVGILLMVFVKNKYLPYVTEVDAETVATGIMGLMGNKGGVAIRMQIHNTSICFVNSHLAAHTEEFERRNQDYRDILSKLEFNGSHGSPFITDHEAVFWLGDLNYRVSDMDTDVVRRLADKGEYEELLVNDQLIKQKNDKKCFKGFQEGRIKFKPTYKYDPGTDNWDTSEKGRAPAWCDRILWRGSQVKQLEYRSHNKLKLSDHKPVSSLFEVGVKVVNVEKERQVMEDVIRTLDRHENENLPQVQLGTTEIIFKDVQFLEKQTATLDIVNTGQVAAQFAFIAKLDETEYCKPWLTVKPYMGIIMPGRLLPSVAFVQIEIRKTITCSFRRPPELLRLPKPQIIVPFSHTTELRLQRNPGGRMVRFKPLPIPALEPDSKAPIFGVLDATEEKLIERKKRAQQLYQDQLEMVAQRKRDAILKDLQNQKEESDMLDRTRRDIILDRALRHQERLGARRSLEESWAANVCRKQEQELEERRRAHSPGMLIHEQCDKYHRCKQCGRRPQNCGESNVWSESRYIPGSRLIV